MGKRGTRALYFEPPARRITKVYRKKGAARFRRGQLCGTAIKFIFSASIGLLLLGVPNEAHAAFSQECQTALTSLPPVSSHYTQRVLDRAEAAIAISDPAHSDFAKYLPGWIRIVGSSVMKLLDVDLRVIKQQRDLLENTACLRIDVYLLECEIDKVREELNKAIQDEKLFRIMRLKKLLTFLDGRIRILLEGARDPTYKDPDWHRGYVFDDAALFSFAPDGPPGEDPVCGNGLLDRTEECDDGNTVDDDGCSSNCQNEMCPFHSDYLPPNIVGYGCDSQVMQSRTGHAPTAQELEGLDILIDQLTSFLDDIQQFLQDQQQIDILLGRPPSPVPIAPDRLHRQRSGCARSTCEFDSTVFCEKNRDCQDQGFGRCLSEMRVGTCQHDPTITCTRDTECDSDCNSDPDCDISRCISLEEAAFWELRGPFSIEKNEPKILNVFRLLREYQGEAREWPEVYKLPGEFDTAQGTGSLVRARAGGLSMLLRLFARPLLKLFEREQGKEESTIFAVGVDASLTIAQELKPLREAVGLLSLLASDKEGIRGFAVSFAYFVRRTCIFRPCNLLLEKIIRIALEDACFPYVNGEFLNDTCENPRWKKCIEAAKLDEEMGFSVPDNDCS